MKITEELWNNESTKLLVTTNKVISQGDIDNCLFTRVTKQNGTIFGFPRLYEDLSKKDMKTLSDYTLNEFSKKYDLTQSFLRIDMTKPDITNLGIIKYPKWLFGDNIAIKTTVSEYPVIHRIYYTSDKVDVVYNMINDIQKLCNSFLGDTSENKMWVKYSLISTGENSDFIDNIKKNQIDKITIDEFNEDLPDKEIHESINNNKESGVFIFHGEPGCGKTSYIKRLISENPDLSFCYLSLRMLEDIEKFRNYIITSEDNKVVIVEDCEKLLHSRNYGSSNTSLSEILNISDGLIGDQTKTKFIFTFNTQLKNIDEAILRPGRLMCRYEFTPLKGDRLLKLLEKLGIDKSEFSEYELESGIPISNLYHYNSLKRSAGGMISKRKVGFNK